jgi:glucose/arabinose dehydrogenase
VAPPDLSKVHVTLTPVATLSEPVAMAERSSDSTLYFAERKGTIRAVRDARVAPSPVLDITSETQSGYQEQGLLGLAFSPDGSRLYVYFTKSVAGSSGSDLVIREYSFSGGRAVTSSARDVLTVNHEQYANHNGGNLVFGPDGYLYAGLGDGGGAGDPLGNGQNLNTLLGKLLRINPRPAGSNAYQIPPDNPFAGRPGARGEIWAYGLRNPWRYSFDRATHDLWIGDVGQDSWEEVDVQAASGHGGDNYGWNRMEGTHSYNGGTPPPNYHGPVYEYSHDGGNCSITGGYVYRGARIPNLVGSYVFADYCTGQLRAFDLHNGRAADERLLGPQVGSLSSFGQDPSGELYVLSLTGAVYRIDPA